MPDQRLALEDLFQPTEPFEKARHFCTCVVEEMANRSTFLSEDEAEMFASYYGYLHLKNDILRNHFCFRHAQRVQPLVAATFEGARVLDAGCGFGSESILCGILGAQVTGVDLIEPRLNTGKKRLQYYEQIMARKIDTQLYAQSVFDVEGTFDIIWSLESISHIDPAESFIAFAHDRLVEGGKLIISDPNRLNPRAFWKARRDARQHGGVHSSLKDPRTGG